MVGIRKCLEYVQSEIGILLTKIVGLSECSLAGVISATIRARKRRLSCFGVSNTIVLSNSRSQSPCHVQGVRLSQSKHTTQSSLFRALRHAQSPTTLSSLPISLEARTDGQWISRQVLLCLSHAPSREPVVRGKGSKTLWSRLPLSTGSRAQNFTRPVACSENYSRIT